MRISKGLKRILTLSLAFALIVCGVCTMPASAGQSGGYVVKNEMLEGETLSQAEWKFDDTGVSLQNGALVFDENYDLENPVLSRTAAHSSEEVKLALEAMFTLNVTEIKGDKQFGFAYGIRRLDRDIDEDGATFLYVQAMENGVGFGLQTMVDGEVKQLKELTRYSSSIKNVSVVVRVSNQGAVTVMIGGNIFYAGADGETTADGYLGFSSAGGWTDEENFVKASVARFTAYNEYYDKPETPLMVFADFSGSEFNTNEWALNSTNLGVGGGVVAMDDKLVFDGAGQNSAVACQFQYSNFELQYDIFDVKNTPTVHTDGKTIMPSHWQQIAWGTPGDSAYGVASYYASRYALIFDWATDLNPDSATFGQRNPKGGMSVQFYINSGYKSAVGIPAKYAFMTPGFTDTVRIRLTSIDGKATLSMKLESEAEFTTIWEYNYENDLMDTGYIVLRSEGNNFVASRTQYYHGGFFSIDNLTVKNYDRNPTLTTVEVVSNRIPPVPDYDYKDPYTDNYLITYTGGKP